ncbi:MAG: VOC family protein [Variovorax sp.]|nr:MAG: VOC family protein [Variovorax sp.]
MQAYLSFDGNCAEAFAFYGECLGGKTLYSMTYGESPMGAQTPDDAKGKIMHATFEARGHQIMGADIPPGMPFKGHEGYSLSVQAKNVDDGRKLFDALSAGGKVTMPFGPQFWSPGFGMLTDPFGVPWMVNVDAPPPTGN